MPVRQLSASSDPTAVAKSIIDAHQALLGPKIVSFKQVERLIKRLVDHKVMAAQPPVDIGDDPIAPSSSSKKVPPSAASNGASSVGAGSSSAGSAAMAKAQAAIASASAASASAASAVGGDVDERDLNKASEEELIAAKAAMDLHFAKAALKPGDAGYVHDKRVAPPAELESNDWDEEIEDFDTEEEEDPIKALMKEAGL